MADQHPNDEYVNPTSRTAAAPIPPESPHDGTGEPRGEDPDAAKRQAELDEAKQDAQQAAEQGDQVATTDSGAKRSAKRS